MRSRPPLSSAARLLPARLAARRGDAADVPHLGHRAREISPPGPTRGASPASMPATPSARRAPRRRACRTPRAIVPGSRTRSTTPTAGCTTSVASGRPTAASRRCRPPPAPGGAPMASRSAPACPTSSRRSRRSSIHLSVNEFGARSARSASAWTGTGLQRESLGPGDLRRLDLGGVAGSGLRRLRLPDGSRAGPSAGARAARASIRTTSTASRPASGIPCRLSRPRVAWPS